MGSNMGRAVMSNYPDGMTSRDWAYLAGDECEYCEVDECECEAMTKEDIEIERLGL